MCGGSADPDRDEYPVAESFGVQQYRSIKGRFETLEALCLGSAQVIDCAGIKPWTMDLTRRARVR